MINVNLLRKIAATIFLMYGTIAYAQFNYGDALAKSILFFDANRCGNNVATNNVFPWRAACHTTDGSTVGLDLTGGFHDAGDHVKFGLPQTWSAATLGFALYEFRESFDKSNATTKTLSTLKYFTDFFLKCNVNANTFYYNVGDGNADHGYWGAPELQTGSRAVIAATVAKPASDVCGEAAAALALMYLNYKSVDAAYATQCLNAAKQIFQNGKTNLGKSDDGGGGAFYKSTSYYDDLSWAAIWLSIATGDQTYLTPVDAWLDIKNDYGDDNYDKHWSPAWDDVTVYALLKMYELTKVQKYYDGVIRNLEWYRDKCVRTPAGLPWLSEWGVLRYASSEAGVGYLAAQKFEYAGFLATGDLTMDYTLGKNPRNSSYLTGWGTNPPVHPHHRANEPAQGGPTKGIVGALVGGPGSNDDYADLVGDFRKNEVALDYNASFILGLAGRIYFNYHTPPKPNVAPTVTLTAPTGGTFNQGAPITLSATAADSDGTIAKVEFYIGTAKVGEDLTAPYSITWIGQLAGDYTVSARAIDNKNGSATSAIVNINLVSSTPPPTTPNLALNKVATASSLENGGFFAASAVDGNGGTRWASAFADPQWLSVDLGAALNVNRVILSWEGASGKVYDIQVSSNGTTWTTVAAIVGGNGGIDDIVFPTVAARYIRMYGMQRNTPYGYSLIEFEVYGPGNTGGNTAPTVSITAPANNASFTAPASIAIAATAADADGTVSNVQFYNGTTLLGSDATAPYTLAWTNVGAGTYNITAVATDNQAAITTSTVVIVTVTGTPNPAPTVSITAPANNASFTAPASIAIAATAADANGTVSNVQFFNGTALLGSDATAPYTFTWANVTAGTYSITAVATDNLGATGTSIPVLVTVTGGTPNTPPTVSLTAPVNNASFTAPASIAIAATAADANGTVSSVQFYNGATLLGSDATTPYTFTWANVAAGTYSLTARATDNAGAITTSTAVSITVTSGTSTADIIGPDCGANSSTLTFELNAAKRTNVTTYNWWYTGSAASTTAVAGSPFRVTIQTGTSFSAGQVCVGTNLSAAPWYTSYCKSITKCATVIASVVGPVPSANTFTLTAKEAIRTYSVTSLNGNVLLEGNAVSKGQSVQFGTALPKGSLILKIVLKDGTTETKNIQKF